MWEMQILQEQISVHAVVQRERGKQNKEKAYFIPLIPT